jgi:hypothetical protein
MANFIEQLEQVKLLSLTKYEALFLSDSVTLLLEHDAQEGRFQIPAKTIAPRAGVGVPLELIHKIGLVVLLVTEPESDDTVDLPIAISELYLIREVCQSYVQINDTPVGYNLLRKVYKLLLESDLRERADFENLLHEVNFDLEKFDLEKNPLKIDNEESSG